jgi:hypothetical protein
MKHLFSENSTPNISKQITIKLFALIFSKNYLLVFSNMSLIYNEKQKNITTSEYFKISQRRNISNITASEYFKYHIVGIFQISQRRNISNITSLYYFQYSLANWYLPCLIATYSSVLDWIALIFIIIPLTHKDMTAHFPGLGQVLQCRG